MTQKKVYVKKFKIQAVKPGREDSAKQQKNWEQHGYAVWTE